MPDEYLDGMIDIREQHRAYQALFITYGMLKDLRTEQYRLIYGLYPMAGVIEGFRSAIIGHNPMPWDLIGMGALSAGVLFVTGTLYFRRMERVLADVA